MKRPRCFNRQPLPEGQWERTGRELRIATSTFAALLDDVTGERASFEKLKADEVTVWGNDLSTLLSLDLAESAGARS